jgi:hypothetical protein
MSPRLIVGLAAGVIVGTVLIAGAHNPPAQAQPRQAPPASAGEPDRQTEPRQAKPRAPDSPAPRAGETPRAQPRPQAAPPERKGASVRRTAPPRDVPPQFYRTPRIYSFPPVSLHRGFYYHPYFGFYYGPYYGPFYPHPGPSFRSGRYSESALRTRIRPPETEVYVNGYYAGVADDFDGVFQRLHLPPGEHLIEFHLDGYRTFRQKLYLQRGATREIRHDMARLPAGEPVDSPMAPAELPEAWALGADVGEGDLPASPYGILGLRVEPSDVEIVIDDEVWLGTNRRTELVIHVPAGWHTVEVRKAGYQSFSTEVELTEGSRVRLNVRLVR